jgi:hypothetical protein
MNDTLRSGVHEASRLTRAGRLTQATTLLQRVLHSGRDPYSGSGNEDAPPTIDLVPDTVEVTGPEPSLRRGQEFGAGARSGAETRVRDQPEALRRRRCGILFPPNAREASDDNLPFVVPGFFIDWPHRLECTRSLAETKEPGARPMCPGDLLGNHGQRPIALSLVFEPVLAH